MTDIEDTTGADNAMVPIPARDTGVYQSEIGIAQLMAKSSLLPKHLHGNPGNCLAVLMLSRDWNMNPIAVGLKTSVIPKKNGGETLMFEGQLVNAIITKSKKLNGRLIFDLEGKGETTVCTVRGVVKGETEERTVTVGMPKTRNSPLWNGTQGDIEQQMTYLGARTWCRRHLPEVLLGVYTPEDDWSERESDAVSERNSAVRGHMQVFESHPVLAVSEQGITPLPENDGFITVDAHLSPKPSFIVRDEALTQKPVIDELDDPIPDFSVPRETVCKTCGGRGIVENNEGKGPCPDCSNR